MTLQAQQFVEVAKEMRSQLTQAAKSAKNLEEMIAINGNMTGGVPEFVVRLQQQVSSAQSRLEWMLQSALASG